MDFLLTEDQLMENACKIAKESVLRGQGPFGCIITNEKNEIIATGNNLVTEDNDPTAHAEIVAIRRACKSLQILDLSPLSNVTTIGAYFLFGCESLNEIDLLPLSNITTIDTSNFLGSCIKLKRILNISVLSGVTFIDSNF